MNHFPLKKPIDDALLEKMRDELLPKARAYPGVRAYHFIRASDEEAIVVVLFDDLEAEQKSTAELAAPWFAANVGPYVSGPPRRVVGEVVVSSDL